jgi:hypothetical protein
VLKTIAELRELMLKKNKEAANAEEWASNNQRLFTRR